MAFRPLEYQDKALAAVDAWLERLAEQKGEADKVAAIRAANPGVDIPMPDYPAKAWAKLAEEKGVPAGKDGTPRTYSSRQSGDGQPVPNATLKVPTGGGKTYLACAALSRIFGRYIGANTGMVLWIVPNEAIYSQTLKALRNRDHPYRQTLDRASANRTMILEKTDPLNRADLAANLCIMVLMLQSSNRENQDSLRLFRDRGDVHGFVPADGEQGAHAALLAAVPNLSVYDTGDGRELPWPMVKASMGNAMRIVRPVVIMDEGQRAVSDLAFSTLYGFNPSLVLELSATPKDVAERANRPGRKANILCEISGRELEREGMIKMPMNVAPLPAGEWQTTLQAAWDRLSELERVARDYEGDGGRYIRPILLVQVERTGSEQTDAGFIHANDARDWLKAVAGLEDDEIAFKTAERNDLDKPENRDLLSRKSPVRAIITKAALAEGWDCPFAYVLCALAANGNESAMTQLVGRILRQPHATKTEYRAADGSTPLDECYVFAHRADTAATVAAIKKGLENDGLGDLARDVHLSGGDAGAANAPRPIKRREDFRALRIALPRVLVAEADDTLRELDAETDLFPEVDWTAFDMAALLERLPKDARPPDNQFLRLQAGDHGVETVSAATLGNTAEFDAAYAVRSIADLVPNSFIAWDIVIALKRGLSERGWDDDLTGRLSAFLIAELRKDLAAERDRQAAALFAAGLDVGAIKFGLRSGDSDWIMPNETWTTFPANSQELRASNDGPIDSSLFFPIYAAELNNEEQKFAVYLDRDDAVRWWHRNGTTPKNYALRGWRRGNVYPDFLLAALQEGERDRIVVIETKGEQLAGNPDTEYKRALLAMLSDKFDPMPPQTGGLEDESFDFSAAVVLFGELDAKLPAVIGGEAAT